MARRHHAAAHHLHLRTMPGHATGRNPISLNTHEQLIHLIEMFWLLSTLEFLLMVLDFLASSGFSNLQYLRVWSMVCGNWSQEFTGKAFDVQQSVKGQKLEAGFRDCNMASVTY